MRPASGRYLLLSESASVFTPVVNRFWFAQCAFGCVLSVLVAGDNQARRRVAAGQAETLNACGGQVRPGTRFPAPAGETGTGCRREARSAARPRGRVGIPVVNDGEDVKLAAVLVRGKGLNQSR